jgi:hypothetical protein
MVQWKDIRKFLKDKVILQMKDQPRGNAWLKGLGVSKDGERLGVCIAIDILSNALEPIIFAEILEHVDLKIGDSRVAFAQSVGKLIGERFNCPSKYKTPPETEGNHYVRVLRMDDLIRYYIGPTTISPIAKPHELRHYEKTYFEDKEQLSLGEFDRCWCGRRERVWVLERSEYEKLRDEAAKTGGLPTVLMDALGFGGLTPIDDYVPELVAVLYPTKIPVHSAQPTAVDAEWVSEGGFYLSYYNEDQWGRTHSSSGKLPPVRERVHPKIEKLTDDYVAVRLGAPAELAVDTSGILKTAYARAEKIWQKQKQQERANP